MSEFPYFESWYLMYSSFPSLNWARLRSHSSGMSEVFDSDGNTHTFSSRDDAIYWLSEDEFTAFDTLDSEDENEYEITISAISVPKGESDLELLPNMFVEMKTA